MKLTYKMVGLLIVSYLLIPIAIFGQPTEQNLLSAWETIQKDDLKTELFEKLGKYQYRFKTTRFPFDGELKILNITIDDRFESYPSSNGQIMGIIESVSSFLVNAKSNRLT